MRYSALHAVHSLLSLSRVRPLDLKPSLLIQGNLLPLLLQSMDEDWYVDTRKLACCTMAALLSLSGCQLTDDARRQVYPELTKRMDDSSNETRIAAAAAVQAFVRHAMPSTYCDTNSGCDSHHFHSAPTRVLAIQCKEVKVTSDSGTSLVLS